MAISRRDCAEAAAITMTTDGHTGKTYDITGPQALAPSDLAELYGEVSGREVNVLQLNDIMLTWLLVLIGTPAPFAWDVIRFDRAIRHGYYDGVDPTFERLAGRKLVTLRDALIGQRADRLGVG